MSDKRISSTSFDYAFERGLVLILNIAAPKLTSARPLRWRARAQWNLQLRSPRLPYLQAPIARAIAMGDNTRASSGAYIL